MRKLFRYAGKYKVYLFLAPILIIGEVVIETVYINENETSHFNPLKDSWKIYKIIFRHMFSKKK